MDMKINAEKYNKTLVHGIDFFDCLGAVLARNRKKRGITPAEMAKAIGSTVAFVSSYENSRNTLSLAKLLTIANVFNVSLSELIEEVEYMMLEVNP